MAPYYTTRYTSGSTNHYVSRRLILLHVFTYRERKKFPTTRSRAWRSGGRCVGRWSGRAFSSTRRRSERREKKKRYWWLVKIQEVFITIIKKQGCSVELTELTVSMSSIILENQNSQATRTIWWGEKTKTWVDRKLCFKLTKGALASNTKMTLLIKRGLLVVLEDCQMYQPHRISRYTSWPNQTSRTK